MSAEVTISARVPMDLSQQVDRLADALRRNRSWIVEEALRSYIAQELAFLEAVEEGVRQMEAGEVVEHAVVVADWESRRQNLQQEP